MIATLVNCAAVLVGSLLGLLFHKRITEKFKQVIYIGVGMISIVIGIMMSLETERILFVALSLVIGGVLGTWWNVEGGVLRVGEALERLLIRKSDKGSGNFTHGFLNASILFCIGAMTIVGSFKAGAEGSYDLIFTKSVMDGAMAVLLTAAMGIGVVFSILTILVYQGGLTLLAVLLAPHISPLVLSELSGTGGILIIMIGLNLLSLKEIKTGNFLPSLAVILAFTLLEPVVLSLT
jgi:uncharacterized protein